MPGDRRDNTTLAPYATREADSAGRRAPEPPHPYRAAYQRDRDRIIHCAAFRRLSHKTQVFTGGLGDYHRTRLTHTLEVVSIARTIARVLRLNEDLVEALALAHDIGHPPFGHAGEELLDERLSGLGGFNHNRQALRILERLEKRYPDRPGLNLSAEVLDGQRSRAEKPTRAAQTGGEPSVGRSPSLEAQVVDAADRIAYDTHDADDALELGLLSLEELAETPLWNEAVDSVQGRHASLDETDLRRAAVHTLVTRLVDDLVDSAQRRIEQTGVTSASEVLAAAPIAAPSGEIVEKQSSLERLLFTRVYRHPLVLKHRSEATQALGGMFELLLPEADRLPAVYREIAEEESPGRAVADYLGGLTDRAVLEGRVQPFDRSHTT